MPLKNKHPYALCIYYKLVAFLAAKMAYQNVSAEDVVDVMIHFIVFWLTPIFNCIFSSRSVTSCPKKCSIERVTLWLPKREWPAGTFENLLAQIAPQCRQKLKHSAANNGSSCWMLSLTLGESMSASLSTKVYFSLGRRLAGELPEDELEKTTKASRAEGADDVSCRQLWADLLSCLSIKCSK